MTGQFLSIPGSKAWIEVKPLQAGWSHDRKYVVTADDQTFLLRVFSWRILRTEKTRI
ncbi:hypothetical protein [Sporolactobacillus inulinus]|uniref:hypothetical protein n=1 Tax=Sporolactobacillus inulinus TaxID=2078 RepID=UPI00031D9E65|nr:hypothetical protein [Sporolactobacillus inulinus]GEB77034.1 hypothetical protein SIN01_13790 [Sporolactobacillus inulinus]